MEFVSILKSNLPPSSYVEPEKISKMLERNSASYKFYWFLAILEKCNEEPNSFIFDIRDLMMDMLYYSYWTVNECHLYLGYQDKLEMTSKYIYDNYQIKTNVSKKEFFDILSNEKIYDSIREDVYNVVKNHVTYRLLTPFIKDENDKKLFTGEINKDSINYVANELKIKIP